MSTAVVVVAHRTHQWLLPSLASVADQCDRLIVVDNGSDDRAVSTAVAGVATDVVRLDRNMGFAGGVNAGFRHATAEVVAVLNDDAFAGAGWLASAEAVLADGAYAAVGPKIVLDRRYGRVMISDEPHRVPTDPRRFGRCIREATAGGVDVFDRLVGSGIYPPEHGLLDGAAATWRWTTGDPDPVFLPLDPDIDADALVLNGEPAAVTGAYDLINSAGAFVTPDGYGGDVGFLAPDQGLFDEPADRFGVTGAAFVTTQQALRRLGHLAGNFFAYYEDLDWMWRAQLAGLRARYDPTTTVRHVGGATSGGPRHAFVRRLAARNRLLVLARNAPLPVLARNVRGLGDDRDAHAMRGSLAKRLPLAVAWERPRLARRWRRSPEEVWRDWAGVGQFWDGTGQGPGGAGEVPARPG